MDSKIFADAVDRVSTISSDKSRAVKMAVEADRLVLSATSPEAGSATEELAVTYGAEAMEIGFNSRYLMDIAAQVKGDLMSLKLSDAASPTLILDSDDENALYVLMPMRV